MSSGSHKMAGNQKSNRPTRDARNESVITSALENEDANERLSKYQNALRTDRLNDIVQDHVEIEIARFRNLEVEDIALVQFRLLSCIMPVHIRAMKIVRPHYEKLLHTKHELWIPAEFSRQDYSCYYFQVVVKMKPPRNPADSTRPNRGDDVMVKTEDSINELQVLLPMSVLLNREVPFSLPDGTPVFKEMSMWRWREQKDLDDTPHVNIHLGFIGSLPKEQVDAARGADPLTVTAPADGFKKPSMFRSNLQKVLSNPSKHLFEPIIQEATDLFYHMRELGAGHQAHISADEEEIFKRIGDIEANLARRLQDAHRDVWMRVKQEEGRIDRDLQSRFGKREGAVMAKQAEKIGKYQKHFAMDALDLVDARQVDREDLLPELEKLYGMQNVIDSSWHQGTLSLEGEFDHLQEEQGKNPGKKIKKSGKGLKERLRLRDLYEFAVRKTQEKVRDIDREYENAKRIVEQRFCITNDRGTEEAAELGRVLRNISLEEPDPISLLEIKKNEVIEMIAQRAARARKRVINRHGGRWVRHFFPDPKQAKDDHLNEALFKAKMRKQLHGDQIEYNDEEDFLSDLDSQEADQMFDVPLGQRKRDFAHKFGFSIDDKMTIKEVLVEVDPPPIPDDDASDFSEPDETEVMGLRSLDRVILVNGFRVPDFLSLEMYLEQARRRVYPHYCYLYVVAVSQYDIGDLDDISVTSADEYMEHLNALEDHSGGRRYGHDSGKTDLQIMHSVASASNKDMLVLKNAENAMEQRLQGGIDDLQEQMLKQWNAGNEQWKMTKRELIDETNEQFERLREEIKQRGGAAPQALMLEATTEEDVAKTLKYSNQIVNLGRFEIDLPYAVLKEKKETLLAAIKNEMAQFSHCHRGDIDLLLTPTLRPKKPFEIDPTKQYDKAQTKDEVCLIYVRGPLNLLDCRAFQNQQIKLKNRIFNKEICFFIEDPMTAMPHRPAEVLIQENDRLRERLSDVTNHAYYLEIFQKLVGQYEKAIHALRLKEEILPALERLQPVIVRETDGFHGRGQPSEILKKLFKEGVVSMPEWLDEGVQIQSIEQKMPPGSQQAQVEAVPAPKRDDSRASRTVEYPTGLSTPSFKDERNNSDADVDRGPSGVFENLRNKRIARNVNDPRLTTIKNNPLGTKYKTVRDLCGGDLNFVFVVAVYLKAAQSVPASDFGGGLSDPYVQVRILDQEHYNHEVFFKLPKEGPRADDFYGALKKDDDAAQDDSDDDEADPYKLQRRPREYYPGMDATGLDVFHYISPNLEEVDIDGKVAANLVNRNAFACSRVINDSEFPVWHQVIEIEIPEMGVQFNNLVVECVLMDSDNVFTLFDDALGSVQFKLADYCEKATVLRNSDGGLFETDFGVGKLFGGEKEKAGSAFSAEMVEDPSYMYHKTPNKIGNQYRTHLFPVRPLVVVDEEVAAHPIVSQEYNLERTRLELGCMWSLQKVTERAELRKLKNDRNTWGRWLRNTFPSFKDYFEPAAEGGKGDDDGENHDDSDDEESAARKKKAQVGPETGWKGGASGGKGAGGKGGGGGGGKRKGADEKEK